MFVELKEERDSAVRRAEKAESLLEQVHVFLDATLRTPARTLNEIEVDPITRLAVLFARLSEAHR